jgi:hypothetical protein
MAVGVEADGVDGSGHTQGRMREVEL